MRRHSWHFQSCTDGRLAGNYPTFVTLHNFVEAESSLHIFKADWSKLSKDDVIDRVKGILYGQAIGDAIG